MSIFSINSNDLLSTDDPKCCMWGRWCRWTRLSSGSSMLSPHSGGLDHWGPRWAILGCILGIVLGSSVFAGSHTGFAISQVGGPPFEIWRRDLEIDSVGHLNRLLYHLSGWLGDSKGRHAGLNTQDASLASRRICLHLHFSCIANGYHLLGGPKLLPARGLDLEILNFPWSPVCRFQISPLVWPSCPASHCPIAGL